MEKTTTHAKNTANKDINGYGSTRTTKSVESTQWRQWQKSTGHGYTAEDSNALTDTLRGNKVKKTGMDNRLHGADRIVNGQPIQCKYCQSARASVNAAFKDRNGVLGDYQYPGQVLEVPADQYREAIAIMEDKIRAGRVPGHTNPADARTLVKAGNITYEQAVKIAKAGNLESLKFDVKNNIVTTSVVGGISAAVSFFIAKKDGASNIEALKTASKDGGKASAMAMATGVTTQQLLRTSAGRAVSTVLEQTAKKGISHACKTEIGKKAIEKTASAIAKKAITGAAAKTALARMASSNVITATVAGIVTSIPDTVKVVRGDISGAEYGKRLACNGAGIGGGCTGTWAGAAIGSLICPGIGTAVGGFIGGLTCGIGSSTLANKIFSRKKDKMEIYSK